MSEPLPSLTVIRKTGSESLHHGNAVTPHSLLSFWQWSGSDLVSNVTRGRLAEFIVATALGVDTSGVRNEWDAFDLLTPGRIKIEVKSAAYVQTWHQERLSEIVWRVPATRAWNSATNTQSNELRRQADVYVLALLDHTDKPTIDPLNLDHWQFYVLPTSVLDARVRSQHSITLNSVRDYSAPVVYSNLAEEVERAARVQSGSG